MNAFLRVRSISLGAALGIVAVLEPVALGQQPQRTTPRIGFVYPAGGQRGTTFTVTVAGQNLREPDAATFSTPGVQSRVLGYEQPMSQKQVNELREQLEALHARRAAAYPVLRGRMKDTAADPTPLAPVPGWTGADEQQFRELWTRFARRPKPNANPTLAESVTLEVTLPAGAPLGECALRLSSAAGLSNPVTFQIGDLPEFTGSVVTVANPPPPPPRRGEPRPAAAATRAPADVTLPCLINGQIMPGEVDRFRFTASAGQRITVRVSARALLPYLADAVPGWFQATLALQDAAGRELAYEDDFRFNPDPVLSYAIPADGDYTIEIKDALFRGREDFVYRIALGELPFITSIFPLGGSPDVVTQVQLEGWNLPATTFALGPSDEWTGTQPLSITRDGHGSNTVEFALDRTPARFEAEPNNAAAEASVVDLPTVIDGRIGQPGDEDVFRFESSAGETVVAEVVARRLGSPLDAVLILTNSAGLTIASNDDHEDRAAGLTTHHADARLSVRLPANDTYAIRIADTQHQGGSEFGYRLRLSPPQPDFALRVVPASVNAMAGTPAPITVYALRRDGYTGAIDLSLIDTPLGFSLEGGRIPAGADRVQLTLRAAHAQREPIGIALRGRATIGGQRVEHKAVAAEDLTQAFAYHHLVPTSDLAVQVGRRGLSCRVASSTPLRIPANGSVPIELVFGPPGLPKGKSLAAHLAERGFENLRGELLQPPAGLTTGEMSINEHSARLVLTGAALAAGQQGNLIVAFFADRVPKGPDAKTPRAQHVPVGFAPAIPFEVVAAPGLAQ